MPIRSGTDKRPSPLDETVAIVLAGGEGSRLRPLTADTCKPALKFARGCRIIDFVIANLVNSGLRRIVVLAQYRPDGLIAHLRKRWQPLLEGDARMLCIVVPHADMPEHRYEGTADAVFKSRGTWLALRPKHVAVFAADHVYRMDVAQMLATHLNRCAHITVAAIPVPLDEAHAFGILRTDASDRILRFDEKPAHPAPLPGSDRLAYASMGNYLFETGVLLTLLDEAHGRGDTDFGHHLLPDCLERFRVMAYDFSLNRVPGHTHAGMPYWRDVGTLDALARARQDATGAMPRLPLDDPAWPIRPPRLGRGPSRRHAPWHGRDTEPTALSQRAAS